MCRELHAAAFGLNAWHALAFAEAPGPAPGARWMTAMLDGALLFNVSVSPARNNGTEGFVLNPTPNPSCCCARSRTAHSLMT